MKKQLLLFFLLFCIRQFTVAQTNLDSLAKAIDATEKQDTTTIQAYYKLGRQYSNIAKFSTAIYYFKKVADIAERINNIEWQARATEKIGFNFINEGKSETAITYYIKALKLYEKTNDKKRQSDCIGNLGYINEQQNNFAVAEKYYRQSLDISVALGDKQSIGDTYGNLGIIAEKQNHFKEAIEFQSKALDISKATNDSNSIARALSNFGLLDKHIEKYAEAIDFFNQSLTFLSPNDVYGNACVYNNIGCTYIKRKQFDLAEKNLFHSLELGKLSGVKSLESENFKNLSELYEAENKMGLAFSYLQKHYQINDSLFTQEKSKTIAEIQAGYDSDKQLQEIENLKLEKTKQTLVRNMLLMGFLLILILALLFYLRYREKQRANTQLSKANEDIKAAQKQLILSEKMASLGALTAGIAHEIKNPLNFVNNFSQVSNDMIDEAIEEKSLEEKNEILKDVKQNLDKIIFHGKRADNIVKGMLLHARDEKGEKTKTDLNALLDEYAQLAWHGKRSNDNTFNCEIIKHYDATLPEIDVIVQDISRVFLNLFDNSFFAVHQKKIKDGDGQYAPQMTITTLNQSNTIEVIIEDNGIGIPKSVTDKIFNPFFTTKDAGQGTGLGLSISYDIITVEHQGKLIVETEEGKYTRFKIILPK